jgi:Zn-dependent protease with chaperone function
MHINDLAELTGGDMPGVELVVRFLINFISVTALVRFIYYPLHKQKDYLFTFFLLNFLIFLICALLSSSRLKIGFAFGLFAVFSMMRYRTVTVPVKEMGYFFACIAIAVVNALVSAENWYALLWGPDLVIILLILVLDRFVMLSHENVKEIVYEKIALIKPERRKELIQDLADRTGLPVHRVEIVNVNFLRDIATVHAYYYAKNVEKTETVREV